MVLCSYCITGYSVDLKCEVWGFCQIWIDCDSWHVECEIMVLGVIDVVGRTSKVLI